MALKQAVAGDAYQRAAVATMVALAELGRRADELCHGVGLLFSVPKGAFAAALKAKRDEDALIARTRGPYRKAPKEAPPAKPAKPKAAKRKAFKRKVRSRRGRQ